MICPHCKKGIHFEPASSHAYLKDPNDEVFRAPEPGYDLTHGFCPACHQLIVLMREGVIWDASPDRETELANPTVIAVLYPSNVKNRELSPEVPEEIRADFAEAVAVLPYSGKASAAISRRVLQTILRGHFGITPTDLSREIDAFIARSDLPSYLTDAVDAIRVIGNFAAHPMKSTHTGEVVQVQPGEAEWLLDVLDALCDHAFVQPQRLAQRRAALNATLADLGKPPLKERKRPTA